MDHYRVTYARREDLRRDLETQIERGGLYVLAPPPDELAYGARCGEVMPPRTKVRNLMSGQHAWLSFQEH